MFYLKNKYQILNLNQVVEFTKPVDPDEKGTIIHLSDGREGKIFLTFEETEHLLLSRSHKGINIPFKTRAVVTEIIEFVIFD